MMWRLLVIISFISLTCAYYSFKELSGFMFDVIGTTSVASIVAAFFFYSIEKGQK